MQHIIYERILEYHRNDIIIVTRKQIFGTGQGSAHSFAIWCFISSILYQCYGTLEIPARYCLPDHSNHVDLGMIGFVDDSNGQTNLLLEPKESPNTLRCLQLSLKDNAQHWADLQGATGGARYMLPHGHLRNKRHPQYLSPYTAHKTLGHFKEPSGSQRRQLHKLLTKSTEGTVFLDSCGLT